MRNSKKLTIILFIFTFPTFSEGSPSLQFQQEQVLLTTPAGTEIRASIRSPTKVKANKKLGALLLFGGFEEAAKILDLIHPKVPVIIASFDYPFAPPRKFEFPASLRFAPVAKKAVHEMIEGIIALTDNLSKRTDVDASRITVVGASFGTPFALGAAARHHGLKNIVLIHGFADIPNTVEYRLRKIWTPKMGWLATPLAWLVCRLSWLYLNAPSPENSVANLTSSQRVLMISAESDTMIPRKSIDALWSALENSPAQHELQFMPGDHLQPGSEALIEKITDRVTTWMQKTGLL